MKVFYRPEQSCDEAVGYSPSAGKPALAVADWLSNKDIAPHIQIESFDPVTDDILCEAHDRTYVEGIMDGTLLNGFSTQSKAVAESLRFTVGSLLAASRYAVENRTIAVSPTSGFHHAGYDYGGGFCTFNGLMVAALHLKKLGIIKHCLIIDGDAHYGDGTDSCIKASKTGFSIHNLTRSKAYRTVDQFFLHISFKSLVSQYEQLWEDIGSTLVIYQAGADAWEHDPLGSGLFTLAELKKRDQRIVSMAKEYGVPLVVNLAGGYSTDSKGSIEPVLNIHRQTMLECIKQYA